MASDRIFLPDDRATDVLGARLAVELRPGDVVLLEGGLGAGKTSLARSIIRTLMADQGLEVPSPSFSLVQPYQAKGVAILHADLYRLGDPREVEELGLLDQPNAIVLLEWPERAPAIRAQATLAIRLDVPADGIGRVAEISR